MAAEMSSCLDLPPFGECGFTGVCESNGTAEFCQCAEGWSQTREQALFFVTEEEFELGLSICNSNKPILVFLYILVGFSAVAALGFHGYYIETKQELLKFVPTIIGLSLQLILAVYRLSNPDDALFADDPLVSFLVGNAAFWDWFAVLIFIQKFFDYVKKRLMLHGAMSVSAARMHQKLNYYFVAVDFVSSQQIFIITISPRQDSVGLIVIKVVCAITVFRVSYVAWNVIRLTNILAGDIRELVVVYGLKSRRRNLSAHELGAKCFLEEELLPMIATLQRMTKVFMGMYAVFQFLSMFWDFIFLFFHFLFPLNLISWGVASIVLLFYSKLRYKPTEASLKSTATKSLDQEVSCCCIGFRTSGSSYLDQNGLEVDVHQNNGVGITI